MGNDLDSLIWQFRVAMTLHRLDDARAAIEESLQLCRVLQMDRRMRFVLALDAATLAQLTGDLPAARRFGLELNQTQADDPLDAFCLSWHRQRQATIGGASHDAVLQAQRLMQAARSTSVGPARPAAAIAEFAYTQAQLGKPLQALAAYEMACDLLQRLGSHPQWCALYLFEQSRVLVALARAHDERASGHFGAGLPEGAGVLRALWRRASAALQQATRQLDAAGQDGLLAQAVGLLHQLTLAEGRPGDAVRDGMAGLMQAYGRHRMVDPLVWSGCELARMHTQRHDTDAALAVLNTARAALPAAGFDWAREQIDFNESLVQRERGDHRRALQAYQRYVRRAAARQAGVPPALLEQGLNGMARQLAGDTVRQYFLGRRPSAAEPPAPAARGSPPHAANVDATGSPAQGRLTPREQEVMGYVSQGLRNPQIAALLGLSTRTVRNHLAAVFRKLGVARRADAVQVLLQTSPASNDTPCPSRH
jgi:DNA-binding NarL/FixJ family response regulator